MVKKKKLLMGSSIGISLMFIIIALLMYSQDKEMIPQQVSVILYGNTIDRWESLKQGIDQASQDSDVEINYVLMSTTHNIEEQLLLIQREIDNGADGILLAANDSEMDLSTINLPYKNFPIVGIDSGDEKDITIQGRAENRAQKHTRPPRRKGRGRPRG
ncbi:hypothetical protein CG709_11475, partial [Lachnotalea glycerini]